MLVSPLNSCGPDLLSRVIFALDLTDNMGSSSGLEQRFFENTFSYLKCSSCNKDFEYGEPVYRCSTIYHWEFQRSCVQCMLESHMGAHGYAACYEGAFFRECCTRREDIEGKITSFYANMENHYFDKLSAERAQVVFQRSEEVANKFSHIESFLKELNKGKMLDQTQNGDSQFKTSM